MKSPLTLSSNISESVQYLTQRLRRYPAVCLLVRTGTLDLNYVGAIHQKISSIDIPHCQDIPQNTEIHFYEVTIEGIPVLLYETPHCEVENLPTLQELYPLHIIANLGIRCLVTIDQMQFLPNVENQTFLIITDHINQTGINALRILKNLQDFNDRITKFSLLYSEYLVNLCDRAIEKQRIERKKSLLIGVPSIETISKTEQWLFSSLNADCIGNIQVLEAIVARYYSMHICTVVMQKNNSTNIDSTLLNERRQHLYGIINFILPDIYQFLATTSNEIS